MTIDNYSKVELEVKFGDDETQRTARPPRPVVLRHEPRPRALIFEYHADHLAFFDTLETAIDRFGIEVYAYSLTPTHYHLWGRTPMSTPRAL